MAPQASSRDQTLFTAERPGAEGTGGMTMIPMKNVEEWIALMKESKIQHVLMLLDDNELQDYPEPGLVEIYKNAGFAVHHEPMLNTGAPNRIFDIIDKAELKGERVVAHCTHGQGRSGRVAAAWLVHRYGLSPEVATKEVMAHAEQDSIVRLGNHAKLEEWLDMYHMVAQNH